jgi:hypothetical protein
MLVMGCVGCKRTDGCCVLGSPQVVLGAPFADAGILVQYPNPCEIDMDFGTMATGQTITAPIEVENVGVGVLDLSQVDPTLDPAFVLDYGTPPPIQPGTFWQLDVTFQPSEADRVQSTFTIQTDGINPLCPVPTGSYSGNVVTVQLTGTRALVDAGPR